MDYTLYNASIDLLQQLIETPSFSRQEDRTAILIEQWFEQRGIKTQRKNHNVWAVNKHYDVNKPSILLNSHHDTVRPNKNYTRDPFKAEIEGNRLYGLGSNDAGACLVSLMSIFFRYYNCQGLAYNLVFVASAEEEISGPLGISSLKDILPPVAFAVVGEPTDMNLAIAEKGLMVIDGYASGVTGHAAHDNTENAIYNAMEDIAWLKNYTFPKESDLLGNVKISITQISAGEQHNVVPAECHYVVDVRVTDQYQNKEIFEFLDRNTKSTLKARSFRLNSSFIPIDHPFVQVGVQLGRKTYGSPTISDQALLSCPSLKIGPGQSPRSHSADEYIELHEIKEGLEIYQKIFNSILKMPTNEVMG